MFNNLETESEQQRFKQSELNNLVSNLNLPKDIKQLLGLRLSVKNLFAPGTTFSWLRTREKEFIVFFSKEKPL